jgi:hypothetical protein
MIDWTFALLFPPDIVKINLESEAALLLREVAADAFAEREQPVVHSGHGEPSPHTTPEGAAGGRPL